MGKSPEEAFAPFEGQSFLLPYRDASVEISTFNITILDCLRGLSKAIANSFFDYNSFNAEK
jgi:cell division cycle 14